MRIALLDSRLPVVAALLSAILWIGAAPARADIGETIILRCASGESLGGFTQKAYAKALKELSSDTEEYSECGSLIRSAQRAAAASHGSARQADESSATQAPIAATASEQRAITGATGAGGGAPVSLGGRTIAPGVVHANVSSALSTLPTPLLAIFALALACLAGFAARAAGKRVRANRSS